MIWPFAVLGLAAAVLIVAAIVAIGQSRWRRYQQILCEDAIKQICSAKHEGRSMTPAELAGRLRVSLHRVLRLIQELEAKRLVRSHSGQLELTEAGLELGLHVLRGHRLWERYLADEALLPMDQVHDDAERAEHFLSDEMLNSLADHLGHPRTDPHGDPIPTSGGQLQVQERTSLTDWPRNRLGVVVHVEDEPRQVLRETVQAGLQPGTVLRIIDRNADAVVCVTPDGLRRLAPAVAANVDVRPAVAGETIQKPAMTLAELPLGEKAEVAALSDQCTGMERRRLLDLGFTAGVQVQAVLANMKDADHAYRIRDTMIALRKEQANHVFVRPAGSRSQRESGIESD